MHWLLQQNFLHKTKILENHDQCFTVYLAVTLLGKLSQNWYSGLAGSLSGDEWKCKSSNPLSEPEEISTSIGTLAGLRGLAWCSLPLPVPPSSTTFHRFWKLIPSCHFEPSAVALARIGCVVNHVIKYWDSRPWKINSNCSCLKYKAEL